MVTLRDFNSTPAQKEASLKDFNNPQKTRKSFNNSTINNVAAHAALLTSPETILPTYTGVVNELKSGTSSFTLDNLLRNRNDLNYAANLSTLEGVMGDPNLSIEEKESYTQGFSQLSQQRLGERNLSIDVAEAALIAPSEPDDNDEIEFTRVDAGAAFDKVDEWNGWVQKQINAQKIAVDEGGIGNMALNIVEMIIPFMEGAAVSKVRQALETKTTDKAGSIVRSLTLLGESKQDVYNSIARMPIENRKVLAEQLINLIQNSGGSITLRPNDLIMLTEVSDFLMAGSYNSSDKMIDNIFSLLDTAALISPIFRGARIGKVLQGASSAETERRAASAISRAVDEAAPEIDEIIYVNSTGDASTDINRVQQTRIEGGDTIFVDSRGDASTSLDAVGTPSQEIVDTTRNMIVDRVMSKLKMPEDVATIDLPQIRQDVLKKVEEILTPVSFMEPGINKQVVNGIKDVLTQRAMPVPRTFNATTAQLVNQAVIDSTVKRRSIRTTVGPTSVSQTVKHVNPAKARQIHRLITDDTSGQAAETLYGTSRTEALADDILPEVSEQTGSVRNKVVMDEGGPSPDVGLIRAQKEARGDIWATAEEKAAMRNTSRSDFENVVGLVAHRAMSTIGDLDRGVDFNMVYGPKDGGFSSPKQAIDQVTFALRKYGITADNIELLAKNERGDWVPTKPKGKGSYLVRVKYEYEFSPADTINRTLTSSSKLWRMFDMITPWTSGKHGGLGEHFVPHTATQDKILLDAASVASDRSAWLNKKFLELSNDYVKKFKSLDNRQKELVSAYIIEANNKSLKFNSANLRARGFSPAAIETVRDWKRVWDTHYYFENQDLNKTLRARGYAKFVDKKNNTELIIRPLSSRQLLLRDDVDKTRGLKAYDAEQDKVVTLKWNEVEELYNNGGQIAATRGTITKPDYSFDLVVVKNNSETSYSRRINDNDYTLNYRDGYYTVRYTDPYFITKTIKVDGKTVTKAIATAGSRKDADAFIERLKSTDEAGEYNIKSDTRRGTSEYEDYEWSSLVSGGRTSQKLRGKQLEDSTGLQTDPEHIHMETPEQSLVHSIASISSRIAFRDFLDSSKARWMDQFGKMLDKQNGIALWPEEVGKIKKGNFTRSEWADAKATWRYINSLDNGYVNLLDDISKNMFKDLSETVGKKGWGWLETAADKASQANPTGFLRKKAFRLLLAANPLRQAPVQAMQALPIIMATNPKMILSGRLPAQFVLINYLNRGGDVNSFMKAIAKNATGLSLQEAKDLAKHYDQSGFEAAVQANSLIRDDLRTLIDRTPLAKVQTNLAKPLNFTQKIGFEAGENALMRSVWLSEYDLLRQQKVKITPEVIERLNARVRHLTLNMNKSGELPYNENMFSAAMQFFQAPHKAFAQVLLGHKGLNIRDRIKLGTAYVLTYGIGGGYLFDMISSKLPNDPVIRETLNGGLFNLAINAALSSLYGEDVSVDFSDSLRLLEFPDVFKFFESLMGMEVAEVLSASPSVGLVLGDNARVANFVKQLSRPFTVNNEQKPEELIQTGKTFLQMFSGASNFFKAKYILEHQKVINSSGGVVDFYANDVEAMMRLAGFATIDEIQQYALNEKTYRATSGYKDDIKKVIDETSRRLANKGISNDEENWTLMMMAEAQRVFGNDPFYMREFQEQIFFKATRGELDIFNTVMRLAGFVSPEDMKDIINTAPTLNQSNKDELINYIDQLNSLKENQ